MSRTQARRFQWYAPESSALKIGEMKLLVDKFTTGAVGAKVARLRREGISFDIDEIWDEMKAKVIEALQKSKESLEAFGEPDY